MRQEEIIEKYQRMVMKQRLWSKRARVRQMLLARKAVQQGITVTEEEVNEYLNRHNNP